MERIFMECCFKIDKAAKNIKVIIQIGILLI